MQKVIDKWRIIISGDCYDPPECRRFRLQGIANWKTDGLNKITSSPIVGSDDNGMVVITRSGSRYTLGTPALFGEDDETNDSLRPGVDAFYGASFDECKAKYPWVLLK